MPSSKNLVRRVVVLFGDLKGGKFGASGAAEAAFRLDLNAVGGPVAENSLKGAKD